MAQIESILRCPLTGENLAFAEDVGALHKRLAAGELRRLDGTIVENSFEGFLKNASTDIFYPVREGILLLLPAFAMTDTAGRIAHAARATNADTLMVMKFYDEIGWTETTNEVFVDAEINEDFRGISRRYIHDCHLRVNDNLPSGGDFIVDVASGPVQYAEYLTYSRNFSQRICCDVSFEALRFARAKLGDHGVYIQCDITNMPLKSGSVDAFVSLHTIYHVPADRQIEAFQELQRITMPGGGGVVVYTWGDHSWAMKAAETPYRLARALKAHLKAIVRMMIPNAVLAYRRSQHSLPPVPSGPIQQSATHFSFHAHTFDWWRRNVAPLGDWSVRPWRSISVELTKAHLPDNGFGRAFLSLAYRLETIFPALMGRIGQYPMLVFRKPK
jgi:ubiquinone/menaquinone biosynthesis C-methylase UbiE/uncharacterized protein YbaR (Trm112 family)